MSSFISPIEIIRGKLYSKFLSIFYKCISNKSIIVDSNLFGKRKIEVSSNCLLYCCRIRVSENSRFVKIGKNVRVENNAFINAHGGSIQIGESSFIGPNCIIQGYGGVIIGNRVMIAGNSFISSSNHIFDNVLKHEYLLNEEGKEVIINDNVWIGSNVSIVAGVTIGEGCVVGAGSVVTRSTPPYTVVVGSPARVIRKVKTTFDEQ